MNIIRTLSLAGKRILQPDASVDGFTVKYNHTLGQFEYQDLRVSALFKYSANNYSDLLTKTGMVANDVALVLNSQGVLWINYKGAGFYVYDGVFWVSDKQKIADQFNTSLADILAIEGQITSLQTNKVDKVGGKGLELTAGTTLITLSGVIAINVDNTKFNVPSGTGLIYKNGNLIPLTWNAFTGVTTPFLGVSPNTFIAIDENSNLVLTQDLQGVTAMGDVLPLGFLEHTGSVIERVGTEPQYNLNLPTQWQQFMETFGNFIVNGFELSANGANLMLNVSAGTMFDNGLGYTQNIKAPNHFTANALTGGNIRYYHRDLSGNWVNNNAFVTNINPDQYDTGTGLANIPSGKYSVQRVTYYPPFGYLDIYYDQSYYNSIDEALNGYLLNGFEENDYLSYNLLIGIVIVKHGTTDLTNTTDCLIRDAHKAAIGGNTGASGGEANTASNVGTAGVGVFKQKTGVDLEFKKINANSNKVSVTDDVANNEVKVDVNEANFSGIPQSAISGLTSALAGKQDLNTLGNKPLSTTAQNPGLLEDLFLYRYNHTSGQVDLIDPKDLSSDYVILGGLTAGNNTAHSNRFTTNIFFANIPANKTIYRVEYRAFTIPAIATTDSFTVSLKNANGHSKTVAPVFATVSALPTLDSATIGGIRATQTWQVLIGSNNVNISTGTGLLLALTATRTANIGNITDLLVTVYFK